MKYTFQDFPVAFLTSYQLIYCLFEATKQRFLS